MRPSCTSQTRTYDSQSVILAVELERQGMPHQFYSYKGLKHHFSTSADAPQADDAADVSRYRWISCEEDKRTCAPARGYAPLGMGSARLTPPFPRAIL